MKRTLALVLALLIAGCCVACQPADDTGTTTTTTTTTADTTTTTGADPTTTVGDATTTVNTAETTTTVAGVTTTTVKKPATTTTQNANKAVTQMKYTPQIKGLPGTKSSELLTNPDRGWYMEVTLNVADGLTMPNVSACGEAVDAIQWLRDKLTYYGDEKPQLIQVFFYLTRYHDKDLDAKAFEILQEYFDEMRRLGVRCVARFAYETPSDNIGPTTEQMLRHMKQLKPFLEKNKDLIHVIQAGFIGLVGEWHHATYNHDRRVVLEAIVDMTPADISVQVRLASYKDVLKKDDPRRARVSYHDDYLVGGDHAWSAVNPSNVPQYNMVMEDCLSMSLVGEMPWGGEKYGTIDGFGMAKWLQKYHYTAISVTHNYIEDGPGTHYEYEMTKWKKVAADKAALDASELRYEEGWLLDENGQPVNRSVFEYIRDYLGYYLTVSDVSAMVSGKSVTAKLSLKNYGFSAPHRMDTIQLVLLDKDGKIVAESDSLCEMSALQPEAAQTVEATLTAPALYAGYKVGIRFANGSGLTARLASDIPYENGINILFTLS